MTRLPRMLLGACMGAGIGSATGLADAAFRLLHPAIGFSALALLAVVVLYLVPWAVLGALLALVRVRWSTLVAVLVAASLLLLVGGYVNVYLLPSLLDPLSILFDVGALAVAVGIVLGLRRVVTDRATPLALGLGATALAALGAGALLAREPEPGGGSRAVSPAESGDILVVLFDALRADHTSVYGYERPTTPTLERLAASGVVFENAYAQSSWTKPSVATLFTGLYPESHQCHAIGSRLPETARTLPQILQEAGYRTGVFAENSFVSRLFGYGRGVERMVCAEPDVPSQTVLGHVLQQVVVRARWLSLLEESARLVNAFDPQQRGKGRQGLDLPDAFSAWLNEVGEDPYFAYVHFMKPHAPYICPSPYDGRFGEPSGEGTGSPVMPPHVNGLAPFAHAHAPTAREQQALVANYDERILFGDALFERILDDLRRRGRLERTAILVIADHGEEFGENGLWDHGHSLQEGVLRVPFVLRYPARAPAARRVDTPVRLIDVGPTVLDLAGLPAAAQFDGRSVLTLLDGEEQARPVLSQVRHGPSFWSNALVLEGTKVVQTQEGSESATRLFRLEADPVEREDLSQEQPALRERLVTELGVAVDAAGLKRQASQKMIVDPQTLERLRALGYVQ